MKNIFFFLLALMAFGACTKQAEQIKQTTQTTAESNDYRSGMASAVVPTAHQVPSNYTGSLTTLEDDYTVDYDGKSFIIKITLVVSDSKIASISLSSDWVDAISLPLDCIATDRDFSAELDAIMADVVTEDGFRAPEWWNKLKRFVRRTFVGWNCRGCFAGTFMTYNSHWLVGQYNTQPVGTCNDNSADGCE